LSIKNVLPKAKFEDATEILSDLRMVKSSAEIALLEKAAKITDEGAKTITEAIEVGKTEMEVALAGEVAMKLAGARELSFPTVLGSGARTELIVPQPSDKMIEKDDLIMMDLGGRYKGYCADMTRAKICGTPSKSKRISMKLSCRCIMKLLTL
jgi:Xaa-Pro aminopeptidase